MGRGKLEWAAICGVYRIKYRDGYYIGNSVNVKRRFAQHRSALKNGTHKCKEFQDDYNKNGGGDLELMIITECGLNYLYIYENDFIVIYRNKGLKVYNIYPSQYPMAYFIK